MDLLRDHTLRLEAEGVAAALTKLAAERKLRPSTQNQVAAAIRRYDRAVK
jgi:hypothetical protein